MVKEKNEMETMSKKSEELAKLYEDSIADFKEGQVVKGRIVRKNDKEILVDIGYKSEGLISLHEFKDPKGLKVGDEVEVFLESLENDDGVVVLSKEKANRAQGWERVVAKHNEGDLVEGKVMRRIKGGFIVDVGIEGFLPASLAAFRENANALGVGGTYKFKIVKMNKMRRSIIVSRRDAVYQERQKEKKKVLDALSKGALVKGVIKNITDFGVFIDLGAGLTGLLHITDMSWGRIAHPSELVAIGDEIEVMILEFDTKTMRISLGLKQKTRSPWEDVETKYPMGSKVTGKVVNLMPYGAFIELEKGLEGLVHISELAWSKKYSHPNELLAIGEKVEAVVLNIDKENRKISLGIKQLEQDPWIGAEDRYKVSQKIKGKVRNITDYGAFVELEDGIDGLVHVSDISWTKKIAHPRDVLKKGEKIETIVLSCDEKNRRIALGIKQLTEDPWDKIAERFKPGTAIKGKVTKITKFGVFVELEKDLEGLLHISETDLAPEEKLEEKFKIGDDVEVVVLRVDEVQKKIALSQK